MARSIVTVYLSSENLDEIERRAAVRGKTRTLLIREALEAAFPVKKEIVNEAAEDPPEVLTRKVAGGIT